MFVRPEPNDSGCGVRPPAGTGLAVRTGMAHIGGRIARNCQILAIAVLALATLFTSGCDECDQGQWACRDGATFQCVDDGDGPFNGWHWVPQAGCTVACHEAGGQTRCVDSREPVPE